MDVFTASQSIWCYAGRDYQVGFLAATGARAGGPVEDYEGQPYTHEISSWPAQPQTQAELENRARDALGGDEYPIAGQWYAWNEQPHNFPHPSVTRTQEDHSCDRVRPAYENPDGPTQISQADIDPPDAFDKHDLTEFVVNNRPPVGQGVSVFLRRGRAHWKPAIQVLETWFIDDWGGWGYRHIRAKHGWSELDRQETRQALRLDAAPTEQTGGKWLYKYNGIAGGEGGAQCQRRVVVDFTAGEDPKPRGIVTSFNFVR